MDTIEEKIGKDVKKCPKCGTDKWHSIRCICHKVCANGHKFRVEGF
jgi:hypothetical protein